MSGCEVSLCFLCLRGAFVLHLPLGWLNYLFIFNLDVFRLGSVPVPAPEGCGGVKGGCKTFPTTSFSVKTGNSVSTAEEALRRGLVQRQLFYIYPAPERRSGGKGERFCRQLCSCSMEFAGVYGAFGHCAGLCDRGDHLGLRVDHFWKTFV